MGTLKTDMGEVKAALAETATRDLMLRVLRSFEGQVEVAGIRTELLRETLESPHQGDRGPDRRAGEGVDHDDRAHRERGPGRARPLLRVHDRHPRGDPRHRARRSQTAWTTPSSAPPTPPTSCSPIGPAPTPRPRPSFLPPPPRPTNTGRRSRGWTICTAIGIWCAAARRSRTTSRRRNRREGAARPPRGLPRDGAARKCWPRMAHLTYDVARMVGWAVAEGR